MTPGIIDADIGPNSNVFGFEMTDLLPNRRKKAWRNQSGAPSVPAKAVAHFFYDKTKNPAACPKCGTEDNLQPLLKPRRSPPTPKPAPKPAPVKKVETEDEDEDADDDDIEDLEVDDDDDDLIVDVSDDDDDDDDDDVAVVKEHIEPGEKE